MLDNSSSGHAWAVKWGRFIQADLAEKDRLVQLMKDEKVEAVIHFAASALVGESTREPKKYFWNNVVNTLHVLDAMLAKRE